MELSSFIFGRATRTAAVAGPIGAHEEVIVMW